MTYRSLVLTAWCCCGLIACSGTGANSAKLKKINAVYFLDDVPDGQPSPHLYLVRKGQRVVVDREILSYQSSSCLVYESVRPPASRVVFAALPDKTPVPIATSDSFRPWHLDKDGIRRFDEPRTDVDGRRILEMEFVDVNDMCSAAFRQPGFREGWNDGVLGAAQLSSLEPRRTTFDVHGTDSVGNTTLSEEVHHGHVEVVDGLLRAGADVDAANRAGITPVMTAVAFQVKDTTILERLLAAGADLNAQDDRGMTALMHAAFYGRKEAARVLLAHGADASIRDNMGRTAATHARPQDRELARILGAR